MIKNKIELQYGEPQEPCIEEFELSYSACVFTIETEELKIDLDRFHFEELREKMNKLYDAVNQGGKKNE